MDNEETIEIEVVTHDVNATIKEAVIKGVIATAFVVVVTPVTQHFAKVLTKKVAARREARKAQKTAEKQD